MKSWRVPRAEDGDQRAGAATLERALDLAEPDGLVLPFAMTGVNTYIRRIHAQLGATDRGAAVQRGRELPPVGRRPPRDAAPRHVRGPPVTNRGAVRS